MTISTISPRIWLCASSTSICLRSRAQLRSSVSISSRETGSSAVRLGLRSRSIAPRMAVSGVLKACVKWAWLSWRSSILRKNPLDLGQQITRCDRLFQIAHRAKCERALLGAFTQVASGKDDDRNMLMERILLEPAQYFVAVDIRHANVKQHQVGRMTLDQF